MQEMADDDRRGECQFMLLYPTVDTPLSLDYRHMDHTIGLRTVNLGQPCQGIHDDLLAWVG